MKAPSIRALGAVALLCWGVHAADIVLRGDPADLLWICNLAGPLVGLGFVLERPALAGVGLLWLCFGTPLWVLDMLGGGEVIASSFASHLGVLGSGALGVRQVGWPRGSWWRAGVGQLAVALVTRLSTPAELNVNLVFEVWAGWEDVFPSYAVYFATVVGGGTAIFGALEALFTRLLPVAVAEGEPA